MAHTLIITAQTSFLADAVQDVRESARVWRTKTLGPEMVLLDADIDAGQLAGRLKKRCTFVRHVMPVLYRADRFSLDQLENALPGLLPANAVFAVQVRTADRGLPGPGEFAKPLAERLVWSGHELDVKNPRTIIHIVVKNDGAYMGVSSPAAALGRWSGGVVRYAKRPGRISRAEFKLLEALEVFETAPEKNTAALDIGAAPGGWSRILAERGCRVTAVDPAELDPRVTALAGVRQEKARIKPFLRGGKQTYDWVVNDMRASPEYAAEILLDAALKLSRGGTVISTLKLPPRNYRRSLVDTVRRLTEIYQLRGGRQLFHNRREMTVCLSIP